MTNNELKYLKQLQQKKFREQNNQFVVEGKKMLEELVALSPESIEKLYLINPDDIDFESDPISSNELKKVSSFKTPNTGIAICKKPATPAPKNDIPTLVFEQLQDPGNLGTIIRTADWFGVKQIVLSHESVDVYNPKVIQSTMGAIFRIQVVYFDVKTFLNEFTGDIYITSLNGESLYSKELNKDCYALVMGNESKGVSESIQNAFSNHILIPNYGNSSESLNVAIATSVVVAEFKREA